MTTTDPAEPEVAGPSIEEPVYRMGLGMSVTLRLTAYSVGLLFLAAGVFSALFGGGAGSGTIAISPGQPLLYVAVYFATMAAHELVHGLFFRVYGGRPRFGGGFAYFMPYFYTTSPGAYSVRQMMVIGLAPLAIISTLSLVGGFAIPAWIGYFAVVFIGNTAGAVGDMWMASRLSAFLQIAGATVVDARDSLDVYSSDPGASTIAGKMASRDRKPGGFFQRWVLATLVVLVFAALASAIGPFVTDNMLIGPRELPLVAFTASAEHGGEWTFSPAAPVVAGLAYALASLLFTRSSRQRADRRPDC